jgi:uncharacterized protein with HEPN domain
MTSYAFATCSTLQKKIKEFVAGTRDRLIHGYFDIDLDIVWNIVSSDLPPLIAQLQKAVQENSE